MSEGHFEAKVAAKRETSAGIFITLSIQPDDYRGTVSDVRVGAHLMVGFAEVVNTAVEPIEVKPAQARVTEKPKRKFDEMPLAQQAGLLAEDAQFREYIIAKHNSMDGDTANYIRGFCCVGSRAELGRGNHDADNRFRSLKADFRQWQTDQAYAGSVR